MHHLYSSLVNSSPQGTRTDGLGFYLVNMIVIIGIFEYGVSISPESMLTDIGTILGIIAVLVTVWIMTNPTIDVYFEGGKKHAIYGPNKTVTLNFLFENIGKRTLIFGIKKKSTVQELTIMIYFPINFEIKEAERQKQKTSRIFTSPLKGDLANKHYIFVPDPFERVPPIMTSLRFGEAEKCQVTVQTPSQIGEYEILFDMSSKDGDLGLSKVSIKIVDISQGS